MILLPGIVSMIVVPVGGLGALVVLVFKSGGYVCRVGNAWVG